MLHLILRELRLAAAGGTALLPLIFFLLVATLFPFAVGPDGPLLARTGGGAILAASHQPLGLEGASQVPLG